MKKNGFIFLTYSAFMAIIVFSASTGCKKPTDEIGSDIGVVGGNINANYVDTLKLVALSEREDSVRADRTSLAPLGSYFDPYFGITTTSLFLNFSLNQVFPSGIPNPGTLQVDSVVLRLRYANPTHFGNIGKYKGLVKVSVYRLLDQLTIQPTPGKGYGSTRNFNYDLSPVANTAIVPNPYDSVKVDDKNEAPHLRIKLNTSFGQQLLTQNPLAFVSSESFVQYFRGLFIKAQPATNFGYGGFVYLFPPGVGSRLTVHYNDSLRITMAVNPDNSVWTGRHEHNYSSAASPFQNYSGKVSGENLLLVQPLSGSRVKVHIPYLKNFNSDKSKAVNKAELIFPVEESYVGKYPLPELLLLARYDAEKDSLFNLADFIQSQGNNGGLYDSERKEYKFNITLHAQAVMSGLTKNDTLVLETANKQTRGNRVALYGTESLTKKVRLRIYYTNLQ